MVVEAGWLTRTDSPEGSVLRAGGCWNIDHAGRLDTELKALPPFESRQVTFDIAGIELLDTAGGWLLHRTMNILRAEGTLVGVTGARPAQDALLSQIAASYRPCQITPPAPNPIVQCVERIGRVSLQVLDWAAEFVSFFGAVFAIAARTVVKPSRLRLTSTVFHMEEVGLNALPIVGLISFLIGVVLAYQGAVQLESFGAQVFVVDLVGVSILREIGILLTAIVVAGRSGSAFTAQLGSMKLHEEVDALRTLGLSPIEMLVLPRILALIISLPILAFVADLMGLLGGGLMCWVALDIAPLVFVDRLREAVDVWSFLVGIIKAPIFALLIAMVGCYEGLKVSGSAESVGRQTTRAVVEGIFLVIIADAFFSIFFGIIGI